VYQKKKQVRNCRHSTTSLAHLLIFI